MLAEIAVSQLLRGMGLAAGTMLVLSMGFAVVLLIASIKLKVVVDEKLQQVHEALPKIDCGACGYAGCASYAKAVVANPELLGKCAPGGPRVAAAIAGILNMQVRDGGPPLRPIVHCRAHPGDRTFYAAYTGIPLCTAANAQAHVQACKFGCLGFGDCTRACKFNALHVVDGLSTVDYEKCTGCMACSKACPRGLIEMAPFGQENMMTVACSSRESGKVTRSMCQVGCIACGLCAKQSDLFAVGDNLARLDYAKYEPSEAMETAMTKCPTGVIVYRGKTAPEPRAASEKPAKASA
jgi:Na+-translocating ferredoxin:NAD+ oxidoreductase RNF subunit RnfB